VTLRGQPGMIRGLHLIARLRLVGCLLGVGHEAPPIGQPATLPRGPRQRQINPMELSP
jgi:hypothetical protein